MSLFSAFYVLLSFPFARCLLCDASPSFFWRSFSAIVFTTVRKKEREREKEGNPISLLFVRFGTDQWLEGTRTIPAEPRRVRVVRRSERTPPTVAHLFFLLFFLRSNFCCLHSFVRSPARSSVRPSSSSSLFLSLHVFAYKAIPRVPSEKSRNPHCCTLRTQARPLADLE